MREDGRIAAPAPSGRIGWIDTARGLGIVLVVIGHVERGLVDAGLAQGRGWLVFDTLLYSFHMALFMVLAGLHVPRSRARGRIPFLTAKLRTVYYPYLLWSLVQGVMLVALSSAANNGAQWSDVWQIPWRPMWHFWFLAALMLYMLLVAMTGVRPALLVAAALAALAVAQSMEIGGSLLYRILYYLPFFVIGILLAKPIMAWRPARPLLLAIALAGGWALSLLLLPWRIPHGYMALAAIPSALLGTAAMLCLAQATGGVPGRALALVGRWSLSIYVMHVLFAAAMRMVLLRYAPAMSVLLLCGLCIAAGLAGPMIVHAVAQRLRLLALLGIGQDAARADRA